MKSKELHANYVNSGENISYLSESFTLTNVSTARKMASVKLGWLLFEIIGWPVWFLGVINNIDNGKSIVLFILAAMFLLVRLYYYHVQKSQAVREKELDLWHKEQDKRDRITGINTRNNSR